MSQKPGGVGIYTCDGVAVEVMTSTCAHCQSITEIPSQKKMTEVVDFCRNCFRLICLKPECHVCTPLMKRIEEAESAYYKREQFRKSLGF